MRVTAPADKRFKRAHLKPARKRARWRLSNWRFVLWAAGVAIGGFAAERTYRSVVGLEVFQVRHIVIHGNHRLSNGELLALVGELRGQSIFTIDLEDWRRAVLESPWVADARLRLTLPSTVDIAVQERAPIGIGRLNGLLYLIDERGTVIDEYGPNYSDLDLPIIDGLSSPRAGSPDAMRAALVRHLMDSLRSRNLAARISQIDVSDARNAVVLLDGDPTSIRLGNEKFVERLESYFDLAPALREQVPNIDYVDLRFDERVYVRPAGRGAAETPFPMKRPRPGAQRQGRGTQTG
jgi:cell division protein FtsQ